MPSVSATAPAKIILLGEHAVVYGQPAIALPVSDVRARAAITANPLGKPEEIEIISKRVHLRTFLSDLTPDHALPRLFDRFRLECGIPKLPAMAITISSDIPIAAGMGSGAAVSVALLKALGLFVGVTFSISQLASMAFESEKAYHGNPSGIDNTVIAYESPIFFKRDEPVNFFSILSEFTLVIANSGIPAKTIETVSAVRKRYEENPQVIAALHEQIGKLVEKARQYLEYGALTKLGETCNQNHSLLQELGVSTPLLDELVTAARLAGAYGAKLTGGGGGGNIIALVDENKVSTVEQALLEAGAVQVFSTRIRKISQNV